MKRFKTIIFSVLLVVFLSSTSFAFIPAIIAGMTLAEALIGTTILSIVATNTAYYVSRNDLPTIGQLSPTIGFIQRYGRILWSDTSVPAAPVTRSAPVTLDIPVSRVQQIVNSNPVTYPNLYNTFYDVPVIPVKSPTAANPPSDLNAVYTSTNKYAYSGISFSASWAYSNSTAAINAADVFNAVGGNCTFTTIYPYVPYQTGNYNAPLYIDVCTHATASNLNVNGDIRRYEIVMPVAKTLTQVISLTPAFTAEIDNILIANPSDVVGMDAVNDPVTSADLVGSGAVVVAPVAAPVTTSLTKIDLVDVVGSATPPDGGLYDSSVILPDKKVISTLLSNLFSNSPLAGIVRGFVLNTSGQIAVVDCGTVYGKSFVFDFTRWTTFLTACGSVLLIIVHGFAILIVMRGWKNG